MKFGKAIRICRAARGLSQKELAASAKVKPSYISLIEAGKRSPSLATLEKIARALSVPTHLIMMLAAEREDIKSGHVKNLHHFSTAILDILLNSESRKRKHAARSLHP